MAKIECREPTKILFQTQIEGGMRVHRMLPGVVGIAVCSGQKDTLQWSVDFLQSHPGSWLRLVSDGSWVIDNGKVVLNTTVGRDVQIFGLLAHNNSKFDVFELLRAYERTMLAGT